MKGTSYLRLEIAIPEDTNRQGLSAVEFYPAYGAFMRKFSEAFPEVKIVDFELYYEEGDPTPRVLTIGDILDLKDHDEYEPDPADALELTEVDHSGRDQNTNLKPDLDFYSSRAKSEDLRYSKGFQSDPESFL